MSSRSIDELTEAIRLDPKNAKSYLERGLAHRGAEDYGMAIRDYDRATELDPGHISAHLNRGNAHYAVGGYELAVGDYTRVLELDPDNLMRHAIAYIGRANALGRTGDYDLDAHDLDRVMELNPKYAVVHLSPPKGDHGELIERRGRAIELDPESVPTIFNRGLEYRANGEYELAFRDYERVIELCPNYATAHIARGDTLANLGDYYRAVSSYDQAIELRPKLAAAYLCRAIVRTRMGDYGGAVPDYDSAIELSNGNVHALMYLHRGRNNQYIGDNSGDYRTALDDYDRAVRLCPNYLNECGDKIVTDDGEYLPAVAVRLIERLYDVTEHRPPNSAVEHYYAGVRELLLVHETAALGHFTRARDLGFGALAEEHIKGLGRPRPKPWFD